MTHTMTYSTHPSGLPDPELQPGFYDGVTLKRAIAWVIDTLVIGTVTVLFGFATFFVGFFFFPVVFLILSLVYRITTIASASATPGMRLVGVEIRSATGHRLTSGEAALHTIFYLVSLAFFLPQILSWGMMLFTERGQGLHDALLGTAVINRPR
jgi:uncharacterized RDD family membrane protein YckC